MDCAMCVLVGEAERSEQAAKRQEVEDNTNGTWSRSLLSRNLLNEHSADYAKQCDAAGKKVANPADPESGAAVLMVHSGVVTMLGLAVGVAAIVL